MSEAAATQAPDTEADGETDRSGRRWWTVAVFAYITLEGAGLQMRGAVIPALRRTFDVPEWQLGLVAPAGTVGYVLAVVVVGAVAGRLDTRWLLLVGIVGTGAGILVMGVAPSFGLFLAALLGRGLFTGIGRGTDRPLLSHLYPRQRGRIFGFYDMMWAVGATAGPLLVAAAVAAGNWRLAYYALALAFVPVVALALWLPTPRIDGGDDPLDRAELRRITRQPAVLTMAVALFLSTGFEGGLFTWVTTYAQGRLPETLATASLSVMLAAYIPGRFASGWLSERLGYVRLAVGLVGLTIPAFVYTFFLAEGYGLLVGLFTIGLALSGMYPTLLAYATEAVPEHSAPVNATAAVTSAAGIAVVPAAMGFVIGGSGVAAAMRLLALPLALLAVVLSYALYRAIQ
ncbi:MFS transporter [Haloarcula salinisoli]|uniref:MFS transporter n=1 Tax=Haloarcula salinisoli TaxID=2487746 RepID=A0A8J8CB58_9EURY|nr:MFS transporter [Halomicroarcula salinisoli]MBX0286632.1 MFS transporter [Halomicroarcula salinisoli]MBX0303943.1 MFS transporter [Halomicroarcula salinisoli]